MKKNLPNFITTLNLVSGSVGVILALKGDLLTAAFLVRLAACFDFLDGLTARALETYSPLGKQLDSLADLISFGLLPGIILYELLSLTSSSTWLPYMALLFTVSAAWRLAKFNIDLGQDNVFIGLSTTAYAIFISTLPTVIEHDYFPTLSKLLLQPFVLVGLTLIGAFLLVSSIRFMALKFSSYSWKKNKLKYRLLLLISLVMALGQVEGIALVMAAYIIFGNFLQQYAEKRKS